MFTRESYIIANAQPVEIRKMEPDEGEQLRNECVNLTAHPPLDVQLEDKEKQISAGVKKLFYILQTYKNVEYIGKFCFIIRLLKYAEGIY